jgi:N-acylglucosamine-6-phosphate 2-epimerase
MTRDQMVTQLQGGFIVSCQALEDEPLFGSNIMASIALAAEQGGAAGIRANSAADIRAIKAKVKLPVIGLYKKHYPDSEVYITPTMEEVDQIVEAGAELVAIDATNRSRPGGLSLPEFIRAIRKRHPQCLIVADVSTYEEGIQAAALGADLVSTTLSGYTPYSPQQEEPDIELVRRLARHRTFPVLAEGRIWTPEQCVECFQAGAHAVVVGTAITRPREITRRFVRAIRASLNAAD